MRATKTYIGIFVALLGACILAGIFGALYVGKYEDARLREAFGVKAAMIAQSLDAVAISQLTGTSADTLQPAYQIIKEKMTAIKKADPSARFVYLMGYRNDQVFFFVDSEPVDSPDYSAPGDVYTDATPEQKTVFTENKTLVEGPYTDSWGNWVSATAPIVNPQTGEVVAAIGIDVNSKEWMRDVWSAQIIPIIVIFFAIVLLVFFFINRLRTAIFIEQLTHYNDLIKQFVYFASHQLRTPLSGIKWATEELIASSTAFPVEYQGLIQRIQDLNNKMLILMRDFLDMSRIERDGKVFISKTPVQIAALIKKVVEDNKPEADNKKITIIVDESAQKERIISADKDRVYLTLDNLISNAIKYSRANGSVTIRAEESARFYTIHVVDSGIGIPTSAQSQIFSNFYRAHNAKSTEGTGIGLYLVKMIMKAHEGKVGFTSTEGKGSDFYLQFPL